MDRRLAKCIYHSCEIKDHMIEKSCDSYFSIFNTGGSILPRFACDVIEKNDRQLQVYL
jgi:hypothetical protein